MPPRFGIQAPKCARCEKSVYLAEQVIGPSALPYHKTCLTCVTCNKRLDSTLLLEHEGQPYCKNCHRAHLGTGKGGFSTAVPLNPTIPSGTHSNQNSPSTNNLTPSRNGIARDKDRDRYPISPTNNSSYQTTSIQSSRLDDSFNHDDVERESLDLQDQVPMIRVTGRGGGSGNVTEIPTSSNSTSTNRQSSSNQLPFKPSTLSSTSTSNINRDHTLERNVRSLDEAVSGSSEMPRIVPRTSTKQLEQSINENANGDGNQDEELDQDIGWDEEFREREREKRRLEKERQALYSRPENLPLSQGGVGVGKPKSVKAGSNEYRQSLGSNAQHSQISFPQDPPPPSHHHQTKAFSPSTIGTVAAPPLNSSNSKAPHDGGGLPEPKRKTLPGASHTAKIASPAPLSHAPISGVSSDQITSGIGKLGLGSSIAAAAGGTPLCARCEKAVYFAEQKTAAGRKWHRACLRCDSCSTTLEAGKLEEGPPSAADAASVKRMRGGDDSNVFCRTCYAKFFGPKGLGVGLSYPNRIGGH